MSKFLNVFANDVKMGIEELVERALTQNPNFFMNSSIYIENKDSENGIFTKEKITQGEVLLQVPFQACISVNGILESPALGRLFAEQSQLREYPDEVMAIGLMFGVLCLQNVCSLEPDARQEHELEMEFICPWYYHLKTLPKSFNTTIYWDEEELLQLKSCTVFHLTQLMKRQIDADWDSIHSQLVNVYPDLLGGATKDMYKWALSIIYSRAVGITRGGVYTRCIPPIIDMANHDPHSAGEAADSFDYDEQADVLKFVSTADKEAGEECCAVYGQYPNSKLLYTYGFVTHGNPHRAIDMWARLPPNAIAAEQKKQLLQSHALTANQSYDFTGTLRKGSISAALLATIRVKQATAEELENGVEGAFHGKIISPRNEAATYSSLRALLTARLNAESAEADKLRLGEMLLDDSTKLDDRSLMALVIRVEERELVSECIGLVNKWCDELEALGEEFVPADAV